MSHKYAFLHIPKTAGVRVRSSIWSNTSNNALVLIREEIEPSIFDGMRSHELEEYDIVSGHYGFDTLRRMRDERVRVTFLREPVSRFVSSYFYWRSQAGKNVLYDAAKNQSIYEMAESKNDTVNEYIDNAMTWQIAGDPRNRAKNFYRHYAREDLLALAKANLGVFDYVGFQDRMAASLEKMRVGLGWKHDIPAGEKANETPPYDKSEIDYTRLRRALGDKLELDEALYAHARERFAPEGGEAPAQASTKSHSPA